jgi:hypothetical protein
MAAELPRPGVEVIQVFQSVTPTVITPTLVPCVVGVCKQIVGVTTTTATGGTALNTQAFVPLQAEFTSLPASGSPPSYGDLDTLVLSINNNPNITITFSGALLTPEQVVAEILSAFEDANVTTATAFTVGAPATATQFILATVAANEFQSIEIMAGTGPNCLSAFGLAIGRIYNGATYYEQDELQVNVTSFPNPNNNLSQVVIDPTSVSAYLYLGSGTQLLTLSTSSTFLRLGAASPATHTGTFDLTGNTYGGGGSLDGETLIVSINGGSNLTVTFSAPSSIAQALVQINAVIGAVATATDTNNGASPDYLNLSTVATGPDATLSIIGGTALAHLGLVIASYTGVTAVEALDQGNGTAVTPLIELVGANLTASATSAVVTGTAILGAVSNGNTLILDDGTGQQTLVFEGATSPSLVLSQINDLFSPAGGGRVTATLNGSNFLVLTNSLLGVESTINVIGGTALAQLFIEAGEVYGNPFPPVPGDSLYVSGQFYATITQVAVGGNPAVVKINQQVAINDDVGESWYIIANGILPAQVQVSRPTPDLQIDGFGDLIVKQDLLRNTFGQPLSYTVARAQLYVAYSGVRQDVSALATNPSLLSFGDTTTLGNQIGPISAANPLALGLYFALLNAPGTQVVGIGVDSYTPDAPFGTVEAFNRAATFLESFEVYAIAFLTHDPSVAQIFNTHVTYMSEPANKGERICLYNPLQPTNYNDTLVASGTNGNSLPTPDYFDTGIPNLASLLLANGITPGSFTVTQGIYLDVGDGNHYSVQNETGSQIIVFTGTFPPGTNDDSFYATTPLPSDLIAAPFAIRVRGAALVLTTGAPDLDNIALTYQQLGQAWSNRRFWQVIGQTAATIGGLEQNLDGFYMCAGIAGMIGQQPPQQSFTNYPMTGFTQVIGTNGYFSEPDLNVIAAGGNYIIVQDVAGAPLIARMALTTDLTSIETRTDSITKVVDFSAKFLRIGLKNFIGRFNITQGFLDSLGHVIQGLLGFLADAGTLIGSTLNNIVQDTSAPDTVLIQVTLDVPFPCNYIMLTLVI